MVGLMALLGGVGHLRSTGVAATEALGGRHAASGMQHEGIARQPGQLTLRNRDTLDVRVEVRVGPESSCDLLVAGPTRLLAPGSRWLVASAHPVCWRRAVDLTLPITAWMPWQRQVVSPGQQLEVTP